MFQDIIKKKKISLYGLAKKTGLSYTEINELYRGERDIDRCSVKVLSILAKSLDLDMETFYKECKFRTELPDKLKVFFWDTIFESLDLERNKVEIISRLLDRGNYETYKFLNSAYTYEDFKYVGMQSRLLTPKTANFLKINFNLKKEEMRFYQINMDWREPCI